MKVFYAFAITFIVAGHVIAGPSSGGLSFAFNSFPPASFHVACFVFGAGYFYKSRNEAQPLKFLQRRVMRLLVPLYAINLVYGVWVFVSRYLGFSIGQDLSLYNFLIDPLFGGHAFMWNLSMWFVAPLFFTQLVDFGLRLLLRVKDSRGKEVLLIAIYLVCGLVTTTLCGHDGFEEYSSSPLVLVGRMGFFLPCYAMGRLYAVFLAEHDTAPNWLYFGVVIAVQIALMVANDGQLGYIISWCWFITGPVTPLLTTATGIAFWLRISRIVAPGLGRSKVMRAVCDGTYSIMAHQFVGFFAVKALIALLAATGLCAGFDTGAFFSDIWYYYTPVSTSPGASTFGVIYVVAGIALPLWIHALWERVKAIFAQRR